MTPAALESRVQMWVRRLSPLGLSHVRIYVTLTDDPIDTKTDKDARAATENSTFYDSAWLEFDSHEVADMEDSELDEVIIHELLHIVFRDYETAYERALPYLGEPARSIWQEQVLHEHEGVIDRLARTIYHSFVYVVQSGDMTSTSPEVL